MKNKQLKNKIEGNKFDEKQFKELLDFGNFSNTFLYAFTENELSDLIKECVEECIPPISGFRDTTSDIFKGWVYCTERMKDNLDKLFEQ